MPTEKSPARPSPPRRRDVVEVPFPAPDSIIAGRKYWTRRQLREYRAAIAGKAPPVPAFDDDFLMTSRQVRESLGGVSDMWLWRKLKRLDDVPTTANAGL